MPDDSAKRPRPPVRLLLVPRRIDVVKDEKTVDTILRMEVDNDLIMVPIGPKLVATLIEGLQRAQQVVTETPTKQ
jgi:hypothetical protein